MLNKIKDTISLVTKVDLKPKDQRKITLFANKAEAIVFWLSVAGLIFLAIVSGFRYLTNQQSESDKAFRQELVTRIEALEAQNELMKSQTDSLREELESLKTDLNSEY